MDSEGFIPIALIASFYRVQALTQDFNLILEVCTQWSLMSVHLRQNLSFTRNGAESFSANNCVNSIC